MDPFEKNDTKVFGENAYVHCGSHGRPHKTGWCTVPVSEKTKLDATNYDDAIKECQAKGLWLYKHK